MKFSIEPVLTDEAIEALYPTYVAAFEPLLTRATARHVLTAEEFRKEMNDPRIDKYLISDDQGRAIALSTVTSDLAAIEWINAQFYTTRYPDVAARGALFYLGYTLVERTRQRSGALRLMAVELNRRVAQVNGVVGFDICHYNVMHGLGRQSAQLLSSSRQVDTLDTQTYFAADFRPVAPEPVACSSRPAVEPVGPSPLQVVVGGHRADLTDQVMDLLATRWPTFVLAGQAGHRADLFAALTARPADQVLLVDDRDRVQGVGLSIPLRWDGTAAGLPRGWDHAIDLSVEQQRSGVVANTTCALSITIGGAALRQNWAVEMIRALKQVAERAGHRALVAPVRPMLKADYPLVEMEDYLAWRTADDRIFDPWVRLHVREGGEVLRVVPDSMTVGGRREQWEQWVGQSLPGSGAFVIDGGLAPLLVDGEADTATYCEPNVWIAHPVTR